MTKLPICISRANNGYLLYGLPYSILAASGRHRNWIEHNYLEPISYINVDGDVCVEYMDASTYAGRTLEDDPIQYTAYTDADITDLRKFVQQHIANGEYLLVFADEYFIPHSSLSNKMHYLHDVLIYGFGDNDVEYVTLSENDRYENFSFSYSQLEQAINAGVALKPTHATASWLTGVRVFSAKLKQDVPSVDPLESKLINYRCGRYSEKTEKISRCYDIVSEVWDGIDVTLPFINMVMEYKNYYMAHVPLAGVHSLYECKLHIFELLMNISDARALAYRESVLKPCKIVELLMLKQQKRRIPEWECIWMQYRKSYKNECDLLLT